MNDLDDFPFIDYNRKNSRDLRYNSDFLLLSHSINSYKRLANQRSYWLTLEKRCLSLIDRMGYDLQTGVWLCLIEAFLRDWVGVSKSTFIFAIAFSENSSQCWPHASATEMRKSILGWYINHVVPVIENLSDKKATQSSVHVLCNALSLLSQQEICLLPKNDLVLDDLRHKLDGSTLLSVDNMLREKFLLSTVRTASLNNHQEYEMKKEEKDKNKHILSLLTTKIKRFTLVFLLVFALAFCGYSYYRGSISSFFGDLYNHGDVNVLTKDIVCEKQLEPSRDVIKNLSDKLEEFERKLNKAELSGGYITISELKTIVHQMRLELLSGNLPVGSQIGIIKDRMNKGIEPDDLQLEFIDKGIAQLYCQLNEVRKNRSSSN